MAADRRPRVLLVTKGLDLGGIERIVVDLAIGLTERNVLAEVAVVNPVRDRLAPSLDDAGVPIHPLGGTDRIGVRAAVRLARLVRNGGFDVVHVHGPLVAAVVRIVAGRVAVVTTSHTPWTSLHPLTRLAWRLTARRDAATVAVSEHVRNTLPGSASERAHVIPHAVDAGLAALARHQAVSARHSDEGVTAITIASHRDAKNYPNLLRAIRHAVDAGADLRLVAIGDGDGVVEHQRQAVVLGIDEVVVFRPSVVDVLPEIAGADLLVVASDYEGQPLVVAEALAVGCPVVATAVGRIPEMVDETVGIVVRPGDPAALGDAIVELAGDPDRRRAMSAAALEAAGRWTLGDVAHRHLEVYDAVTGRARG